METSEQLDFGLDLRLLGKLNVHIDWYKKTTKDWLLWAKQSNPPSGDQDSEPMPDFAMNFSLEDKPKEPCRILAFKPLKEPGGDGK